RVAEAREVPALGVRTGRGTGEGRGEELRRGRILGMPAADARLRPPPMLAEGPVVTRNGCKRLDPGLVAQAAQHRGEVAARPNARRARPDGHGHPAGARGGDEPLGLDEVEWVEAVARVAGGVGREYLAARLHGHPPTGLDELAQPVAVD